MYYFIPAWYGTDRIWHSTTSPWYWTKDSVEFDDTINQLRIFQDAGIERLIIIPHYSPQLRYFLHRQDLLETDYISVFDELQGISPDKEMAPLQFEDLNWPSFTTFTYTPFQVLAFCKGEQIAKIDMGVDGNLLTITHLRNGKISYVEYVDDRGFISSAIYYKDDVPYFQEYLRTDGIWVLRELIGQERPLVIVNEEFKALFQKDIYEEIQEVIREKMISFLGNLVANKDQVVVAAHPANLPFLREAGKGIKKVLSFYGNRHDLSTSDSLLQFALNDVKLIITDSEKNKEAILAVMPSLQSKIHHVTSFDSRLRLGSSQERKESKIYFYVGEHHFLSRKVLKILLEILAKNPLFEIVFVFYNASENLLLTLRSQLNKLIEELSLDEVQSASSSQEFGENQIQDDFLLEEREYRYQIKNFFNENDIIKELEKTRLIIDLNEEPNLYTQIAGISAGIPQINKTKTEYVDHLKNGYVLTKVEEIEKAMNHFLKALKPWNESLIYSIEKIQEYTGQRLIEKWEKWMKE